MHEIAPLLARVKRGAGWPNHRYPLHEKLIAGLGGLLGISLLWLSCRSLLGAEFALLLVPSLGASAVLIFAVPHSPLTQPWSVFGGHFFSALIGVACQQLIPHPALAAGSAVGLALVSMHTLRCIHPPGGATALTAVIGGPLVHQLGFSYALSPVALNALLIILLGCLYNYAFPWRRYPLALMPAATPLLTAPAGVPPLRQSHIEAAMAEMRVILDVSPGELCKLFEAALRHAEREAPPTTPRLRLGGVYGNNQTGPAWSVRRIIDERPSDIPAFDLVVYQIMAGEGRGRMDSCPRSEFQRWARCEIGQSELTARPG